MVLLKSYMVSERKEAAKIAASTDAAIEYVEKSGISINCDIPRDSRSIPLLIVELKGGHSEGGATRIMFGKLPLEVLGVRSVSYIAGVTESDKSIEILPAYTALLKSIESIEKSIDEVELIYLVDRTAYAGEAGEDTALPYWKISSEGNSYYYSAFSE